MALNFLLKLNSYNFNFAIKMYGLQNRENIVNNMNIDKSFDELIIFKDKNLFWKWDTYKDENNLILANIDSDYLTWEWKECSKN